MKRPADGDSTSPSLLARVTDWRDHTAWADLVRQYDPEIRRFCRGFRFDPQTLEDLMQLIWLEIAQRMKTYQYDPSKTFRGWLKRLCQSRAIDLIRKRKPELEFSIEHFSEHEFDESENAKAMNSDFFVDDRPDFVKLTEEIQASVRATVDEKTWLAFWWIVVEERPITETADEIGISYAAAFAARKRVQKKLQDAGNRSLLERSAKAKSAKAERENT
jgi:RNA polymerase sigma-70 factor (ECF subfamily)